MNVVTVRVYTFTVCMANYGSVYLNEFCYITDIHRPLALSLSLYIYNNLLVIKI